MTTTNTNTVSDLTKSQKAPLKGSRLGEAKDVACFERDLAVHLSF